MAPTYFNAESDVALMRRAQQGELEGFAELFLRYRLPLLRTAESRLGRADWAEDVVQETFLAAYKSRHTFNHAASFRTWLWTILLNQCHRHYQSRQRQAPAFAGTPGQRSYEEAELRELLVSLDPPPPEQLLARERRALLDHVLSQLPPVQADALRLRFFGELTFREIAVALGCSLLTAKNRVRAGLLKMSEALPLANWAQVDSVIEEDAR